MQLQFNYADYDDPKVQSRKCYEVCVKHGKPVIVMEPVKGGNLVNLPESAKAELDALHGGSAETQNDHRLAMSAAVAACAATGEVTVDNDACVAKSYPRFWEDYGSLKGEGL